MLIIHEQSRSQRDGVVDVASTSGRRRRCYRERNQDECSLDWVIASASGLETSTFTRRFLGLFVGNVSNPSTHNEALSSRTHGECSYSAASR